MTRIVLHPSVGPRFPGDPAELFDDWAWWRTTTRGSDSIVQSTSGIADDMEVTTEFNQEVDPDTELHDPPVVRVITLNRTSDFGFDRRVMESRSTEVVIVWKGSPGPRWQQLPGNTCRPGSYEVVEMMNDDQRRGSWSDAYERRWDSQTRRLRWPPQRAVRRRPLSIREAEEMLNSGDLYAGQLDDTLLAFQRAANGLYQQLDSSSWYTPSRAPAPQNSLNDWMRQISEARVDFETTNRERPTAILMSPGDMDQLRRLAARFEDFTPPNITGVPPSPLGSVLGLEIIGDRNVPPGQIFIVGGSRTRMPPPGVPWDVQLTPPPSGRRRRTPSSERGRRLPPPMTARVRVNDDGSRSYVFDAPNGTYDAVEFEDGTVVEFQSVTMSAPGEVTVRLEASGRSLPPGQPRLRAVNVASRAAPSFNRSGNALGPNWGDPTRVGGIGFRTQDRDEVLAWGGEPVVSVPRYVNPNVLPESEIVDEIDRLVNESVRVGPVDDYNVDRYPDCKECSHDWHGLECMTDDCDCINVDWLGPDQRTKHLDFEPTPIEIQRPEGTRIRNLDFD